MLNTGLSVNRGTFSNLSVPELSSAAAVSFMHHREFMIMKTPIPFTTFNNPEQTVRTHINNAENSFDQATEYDCDGDRGNAQSALSDADQHLIDALAEIRNVPGEGPRRELNQMCMDLNQQIDDFKRENGYD